MSFDGSIREREQLIYYLDHLVFALSIILLFFVLNYFVPDTIPSPIEIVDALYVQLSDGSLIDATIQAVYAIFLGYFISIVLGIGLGLFMGLSWHAEQFFDTYVTGLYVLPVAAVVPAFIVWFGTGFRIRVIVVVLFAAIPILINTMHGVHETPPNLIEATKAFGANHEFVIKNVILPHQVPYMLAGLRIGLARSIKGLVIVELIVAVTGFGAIISRWSAAGSLEGVFSVVIILALLGVLSTWVMGKIIDRFVHWDISEVE